MRAAPHCWRPFDTAQVTLIRISRRHIRHHGQRTGEELREGQEAD